MSFYFILFLIYTCNFPIVFLLAVAIHIYVHMHMNIYIIHVYIKRYKLESRFPREISITSDMHMIPPLWQKVKN